MVMVKPPRSPFRNSFLSSSSSSTSISTSTTAPAAAASAEVVPAQSQVQSNSDAVNANDKQSQVVRWALVGTGPAAEVFVDAIFKANQSRPGTVSAPYHHVLVAVVPSASSSGPATPLVDAFVARVQSRLDDQAKAASSSSRLSLTVGTSVRRNSSPFLQPRRPSSAGSGTATAGPQVCDSLPVLLAAHSPDFVYFTSSPRFLSKAAPVNGSPVSDLHSAAMLTLSSNTSVFCDRSAVLPSGSNGTSALSISQTRELMSVARGGKEAKEKGRDRRPVLAISLRASGSDELVKMIAATAVAHSLGVSDLAAVAEGIQEDEDSDPSSGLGWRETLGALQLLSDSKQSAAPSTPASSAIAGGASDPSSNSTTTSRSRLSRLAGEDKEGTDTAQLRAQIQELQATLASKIQLIESLERRVDGDDRARSAPQKPPRPRTADRSTLNGTLTGDRRPSRAASPAGSTSSLTGASGSRPRRSSIEQSEASTAPAAGSETEQGTATPQGSGQSSEVSGAVNGRSPGGESGRVIASLTEGLTASKEALDATKEQLRASQQALAASQRNCDELRDTIARYRLESDSSGAVLARKERLVEEALERARKAETQAKELGRASREWGTRVREVEEELGDLRRRHARAEKEYEVIASAWKGERERMGEEVRKVKEEVRVGRQKEVDEVKQLKEKLLAAQAQWTARGEERDGLGALLQDLEEQRTKAHESLDTLIQPLLTELREHEQKTAAQDATVHAVDSELRRILNLMRRAVANEGAG